uniref:Uncharacterized protein n=1 Tax=viral metagenome TaxID=1070528 RepID=A0A6C0HHZ0_9ZZZZ
MSFVANYVINTCSECNETLEDEFEPCLDCGKQNICSYCIRTLSQDGNSYYGCIKCSEEETKMLKEKQLRRRKIFIDSVRLSCAYRGVIEDESMTLLNEVLEDYLKNGTLSINKEIMIVDNDKVDNGTSLVGIKYKSIKYKMVLNLYNYNCLRSDTFTINSA